MSNYEMVIGLEVHAQLRTETKVWCSCEVGTLGFENTAVCEVCSGQPGTLPKLNKKVVEYGVKSALALGCVVNQKSHFDRKNYFYPDLPKGYQVTQFQVPIAEHGGIEVQRDGKTILVGIEKIQIEEDTGKSLHEGERSLIDLNRAGTPLIEIVGKPDISSAEEAVDYLKKLRAILIYLDVCKGNMQDGNFRCDVNLSIRPKGSLELGTRTEVKNLNSFRNVEKAIAYEFKRHCEILKSGKKVSQQTLIFDPEKERTQVLREKSDADDYRYFPEPDLPPLVISDSFIKRVKEGLPELPEAKKKRFEKEYSLSAYDASLLSSEKELGDYYEKAVDGSIGLAKKIANWILGELLRFLNEAGMGIEKSPVKPGELRTLVQEIEEGRISGKIGKEIFLKMFDTGRGALELIEESGAVQISDDELILNLAKELVDKHPNEAQQVREGRDRVLGFFVGQIMKATKGQANPKMTSDIVKKVIQGDL